jgi:hypothetical protein
MRHPAPQTDLVVLTADKNTEWAIRGLLGREQSLDIRKISHNVYVHVQRDPGVLCHAHDFLRPFVQSHRHALAVLDREGCGKESNDREELERIIEVALRDTGWGDRARAIVIDPELEAWVWSDSPHVRTVVGWDSPQDLTQWLRNRRFQQPGELKPTHPKEALEAVLRLTRKPRSSDIYRQLARKVGVARCVDGAFNKLRTTLRAWFPAA